MPRIWTIPALVALSASVAAADFSQDYSGDINAPTDLGMFAPGLTTVEGQVNDAWANFGLQDIDVFRFSVSAGHTLTSITYDSPSFDRVFLAIASGVTFPTDPNGEVDVTSFLGGGLPGGNQGEILHQLSFAEYGGSGFSVPLGSGEYTFYVQQIGNSPTDYLLGFTTVAPAPGAAGLLCVGALRRRRRSV